jgi:hypothetical protein
MGVRSFVMGIFDWVYEEPQLRVKPHLMIFENLTLKLLFWGAQSFFFLSFFFGDGRIKWLIAKN